MDIGLFLRGLLIGLSIAATVGPMSILCIQRTLKSGFRVGFISGLGIATADGIYGCVAGLGLTVIATFLVGQQHWVRLIGGLCLLYIGLHTLLSAPATRAAASKNRPTSLLSSYLSTFLLTLTNPTTILSFVAIFAGLGVVSDRNSAGNAILVVCGVFLGSTLWWAILTCGVNSLRNRLTPQVMQWINRASGLIIITFGIIALISLL